MLNLFSLPAPPLCLLFQHGMINHWWSCASKTKRIVLTANLTSVVVSRNTENVILLYTTAWHALILSLLSTHISNLEDSWD